tara:strand:+ start:6005 stop:6193 length:189 start_codon:yes stop_codon:yes gene_type:complete
MITNDLKHSLYQVPLITTYLKLFLQKSLSIPNQNIDSDPHQNKQLIAFIKRPTTKKGNTLLY